MNDCGHVFAPAPQGMHSPPVRCVICGLVQHNTLPSPGWQSEFLVDWDIDPAAALHALRAA